MLSWLLTPGRGIQEGINPTVLSSSPFAPSQGTAEPQSAPPQPPQSLARLQLAKVASGQVLCQFGTASPGVSLLRVTGQQAGRGMGDQHP